ncbi:MAG: DMT family transporter [Pirellulales bacterium]|jgi:drug/metabolite transporter (DMT)-like permease|nr:DMT family transporter [Thermoguttaceae bacterium]MDD4788765.1 DMT family transporter [Pirellulales bacterium]NLZ02781.1 DMT family transporter [Pirellulaceae bacterium]
MVLVDLDAARGPSTAPQPTTRRAADNLEIEVAYLWMLVSAFSFATMGALAHALRDNVDWQIVALVRAFVTLVVFGVAAVLAGVKLHFWRPRSLWLRSLPGGISLVCTFFALAHLPVSIVITLTNIYPIWVAFLSWPLLRQRPRKSVWLAALAGVVGVALVQQPQVAVGNYAVLVAVLGSFTMALAMIALHRLQDMSTQVVVFHFSLVALMFALASLFFGKWTVSPSTLLDMRIALTLAGVGVAATFGQLFITLAYAAGPPSEVAVVSLTQVLFAFGYDTLFWGHAFRLPTLIGMVLVVAPTLWFMATARKTNAVPPQDTGIV